MKVSLAAEGWGYYGDEVKGTGLLKEGANKARRVTPPAFKVIPKNKKKNSPMNTKSCIQIRLFCNVFSVFPPETRGGHRVY